MEGRSVGGLFHSLGVTHILLLFGTEADSQCS
jgi:hypothetical protein